MKKETDLDGVKSLAKTLLMTDIAQTKFSPMIVQHPFTNSGIVCINSGGEAKLLHIAENSYDLSLWQEELGKAIDKAESAIEIFYMLNTPYSLTFLKFAEPYLDKSSFSKMLGQAWINSEYTSNNANVSKAKLAAMFRNADPTELMSTEELDELAELDETVTVYRGVTKNDRESIHGMSWTLDYETAEWFSKRFGKEGKVYEAQIDKENILALFNGRNEAEIVVDPKELWAVHMAEDLDKSYEMKGLM